MLHKNESPFSNMTPYEFDLYLTEKTVKGVSILDAISTIVNDELPLYDSDSEDIVHLFSDSLKQRIEVEMIERRLIRGKPKNFKQRKLFG